MNTATIRRISATSIAAAAMLGLTACGSGGQSVADACKLVDEQMQEAAAGLQGISPTDPEVGDRIGEFSTSLSEAADTVTNEEVKPVIEKISASFGEMSEALATATDGDLSKLTELQETANGLQTTLQEYTTLCTS